MTRQRYTGTNFPISVIMTTCNGEKFLSHQIDSVLSQLDKEDEMVIVDDASTDNTKKLIRAYCSKQIQVVANVKNLGVKASFNLGLTLAQHEIIFLCDQDDIWLPGKRDAFVAEFLNDSECLIAISDAQVIDESGCVVCGSFMSTRGGFRSDMMSNLIRNRYLGCSMAIHRRLLKWALPIPEFVPMHDMWLGALGTLSGTVRYLPQVYLQYRRHERNLSPLRHQSVQQMIRWRWNLLRAVIGRRLQEKFHRRQSIRA